VDFLKNIFAQILIFFYNITADYGLAIILLTLLVRLVTLPLSIKQINSTRAMQRIAPEQKKLQEKYKDNPDKLNKELMELYKVNKVSPFGGCLPLLIQFPVLIAVFAVLKDPKIMYDAIPGFSPLFAGVIDLNKSFAELIKEGTGVTAYVIPAIIPVLSAVTTYFQSKLMTAGQKTEAPGMGTMTMLMPLMILFFGYSLPQGLPLYWLVGNIFQIVQNLIFNRPAAVAEQGGEEQ
jgi:YidC/Oxa1 family membrane protein insertase